jgi:hypothetical protein
LDGLGVLGAAGGVAVEEGELLGLEGSQRRLEQ